VAELIFRINQSTFRGRLAAEPDLPGGEVEEDGRQRWFSLDEINELRRKMKINRKTLMPPRPRGKRAFRAAVANFKGGAGKSTVALHFAHAAALDGYRVLSSTSTRRPR
jgi:chromosome partitioning protein